MTYVLASLTGRPLRQQRQGTADLLVGVANPVQLEQYPGLG